MSEGHQWVFQRLYQSAAQRLYSVARETQQRDNLKEQRQPLPAGHAGCKSEQNLPQPPTNSKETLRQPFRQTSTNHQMTLQTFREHVLYCISFTLPCP